MIPEFIDAEALWSRWTAPSAGLVVPLGLGPSGEVVDLDLSEPTAHHLLIGGSTGSGKSVLLNMVVAGLTRHYGADRVQVAAIDPKASAFDWLEAWPHCLAPVAVTMAATEALLDRVLHLMLHRHQLLQVAEVDSIQGFNARADQTQPSLVLLVDEILDVSFDAEEIAERLLLLLHHGGRAGIHVLATTQRPTGLPAEMIEAFPARIAMRTPVVDDSLLMLGSPGAAQLTGRGHALLRTAESDELVTYRGAYVDEALPLRGVAGPR